MRAACIAILLVGCSSDDATLTSDADPTTPDGATPTSDSDPGPGPTETCPVTADAQGFFTLSTDIDHVARLPIGYDATKPYPLLVAIHGCGDTALNFATWGAAPYDLRATQSYIAISIGGRDDDCWNLASDIPSVEAAIARTEACFYVNRKKVVLAGYSSGGMMAYKMGMTGAAAYAGILIENSGLKAGVGNVDAALAAVAWKINVAHTARLDDGSFPIAPVRADRDKMLAAQIPLTYRELPGTHDGTTDDWAQFLIPAMTDWTAP